MENITADVTQTVIKKVLQDHSCILIISLIIFVWVLSYFVIYHSNQSKKSIIKSWDGLFLLKYKEFKFFIEKASAYRRLFILCTAFSYSLKVISLITTFMVVYAITTDVNMSKLLLLFSSISNTTVLLFPIQKYIDLFSDCCIKMENCIFECDNVIKNILLDNDKEIILYTTYSKLIEVYIKCEQILHIENKI